MQALPGLVECGALLLIGYNLRSSGLFRTSDGETALRLATYLTLPSVIFRSLSAQSVSGATWLAVAVGTICMATQTASNWLSCASKHKRERAVISGSATGSSLHLLAYPLVETVFGSAGLQPLALMDAVNHVAVWVGSYLLFATAGPAFPEQYKHEDGGTYRGQWRGMRKEGLGVYAYPSGAKYEGEWRDNLKDGRGVYYFTKGGTYEGEWSNGKMNGVGVRTFSTGQVKAGRWRDGQLESPLELWQCASAAEGAAESALAARRVDVGGGKPADALKNLALQAPFWACLLGVLAGALHMPPLQEAAPALDAVTRALASANRPLLLLAAGMVLRFELPQPRMVRDVLQVVSSRLLVPLFMTGTLLLAAGRGRTSGELLPIAVVLVALLAPVAPTAQQFARTFRLSESLASAIVCSSNLVCIPAMALACAAAAASGCLLPGASTAATLAQAAGAGMQQITAGGLAQAAGTSMQQLTADGLAQAAGASMQQLAAGHSANVLAHAAGVGMEQLAAGQPAHSLLLATFCLASALAVQLFSVVAGSRAGGDDDQQIRMVYQGAAGTTGGTGSSPGSTGGSTGGSSPSPAASALASGRLHHPRCSPLLHPHSHPRQQRHCYQLRPWGVIQGLQVKRACVAPQTCTRTRAGPFPLR